MNKYNRYRLNSGLRVVHRQTLSPVAYCGVVVNVGSRDENRNEQGLAHFIEHLLFKGTKKRKARQVINRLEDVGGELNAFTTKEETVLYAGILKQYSQRAIELIADMVQNSIFPQNEIDKEREVVKDEILSYKDSPSELIIDEFEEMIFQNSSLAHNILGDEQILNSFNHKEVNDFYQKHYTLDKMVFFFSGNISEKQVVKWCEKYFIKPIPTTFKEKVQKPIDFTVAVKEMQRNTFQAHTIIGGKAYDFHSNQKTKQALLNNIIGGAGMNSLMNLSLREKHGLTYNVEAVLQTFTDCGWWAIYFATENENYSKSRRLVLNVLEKVKSKPFSNYQLNKYKKQFIGQLVISAENNESSALALGKSILRYGKQKRMEQIIDEINEITPTELQELAHQLFDKKGISELKFY